MRQRLAGPALPFLFHVFLLPNLAASVSLCYISLRADEIYHQSHDGDESMQDRLP